MKKEQVCNYYKITHFYCIYNRFLLSMFCPQQALSIQQLKKIIGLLFAFKVKVAAVKYGL